MSDKKEELFNSSDEDDDEEKNIDSDEMMINIKKQILSNEKDIDVNGITYEQYKKEFTFMKNKLIQCIYCQKYFKNEKNGMITKEFDENGEPICYHCIFWINYKAELRQTVDGVFGKTIYEYITDCKDCHNQLTCIRNTGGGCFLCDYLNKIPLEGIIGADELTKDYNINIIDKIGDLSNGEFNFDISI